MARFGRQRILGRVIVLLMLIIAIIIGGLFWFDYLGLIDAKAVFSPVLKVFKLPVRSGKALDPHSLTLLDDERMAKQMEAIEAMRQELDMRNAEAQEKESELLAMMQEFEDRESALMEKENSFNSMARRYDDRRANIDQNARYLSGMPPRDAVGIMEAMDDQTLIDILRAVEEQAALEGESSVVAYWLSLMPAERSAAIQRKMTEKPSSLD